MARGGQHPGRAPHAGAAPGAPLDAASCPTAQPAGVCASTLVAPLTMLQRSTDVFAASAARTLAHIAPCARRPHWSHCAQELVPQRVLHPPPPPATAQQDLQATLGTILQQLARAYAQHQQQQQRPQGAAGALVDAPPEVAHKALIRDLNKSGQ